MKKTFLPVLILLTLAGCIFPVDAPPPPTALPSDTPQPTATLPPTLTPIPLLTQVATQPPTSAPPLTPYPFCDDPRARDLIASFSKAVAAKDGGMFSSLVSPSKGMDVRYLRDGNLVNYDVEHARYVFETTFEADWGPSPASGESVLGSFQGLILPSLQKVFTPNAETVCDQIKLGGATYQALWEYQDMDFYSVHFPGTEANGRLDWETWAIGMSLENNRYLVSALLRFAWEP